MGSEKKMNDGTSFEQSEKPILCVNGCGFFGTAAMMNFCSKCYRDLRLKEDRVASAKAAVEKSMSMVSPPPVTLVVEKKSPVTEVSTAAEVVVPGVVTAAKGKNRCEKCNKKVGVMGFKCRCGATFCGGHRYPEEHECSFDFKGFGRDAIAKANPVVKADKVERF